MLRRLAPLASEEFVLVGGQAVNFWVDYYRARGRIGDFKEEAPFTSKDIDFLGGPEAVKKGAELLNGDFQLAGFDDAGPNSGLIFYVDPQGTTRTIDVLREVFGVDSSKAHETAIPFEVLDSAGSGSGVYFFVLHPVYGLFSRASNTAGLPGYATEHALRQLKASILCSANFLADLCARGHQRTVLKLNERILAFAGARQGLRLFAEHGIDVFQGAYTGDGLPTKFYAERLPRMHAWLDQRRASTASPPGRSVRSP